MSSSHVDFLETRLVFIDSLLPRRFWKKSLGSLHVLILILLGKEEALEVLSEDCILIRVGFIMFKIIILIIISFKLILEKPFF